MSVSDLVGEIEGVRRRTRRATRGGAVPLAILGLLVVFAAPVYAAAWDEMVTEPGEPNELRYLPALRPPSFLDRLLWVHPNGSGYEGIGLYWLLAAPVAFAAVAAYYTWRARRTGLSVDGWRIAAVGAALFGALVATMAAGGAVALGAHELDGVHPYHFVNPFLVVAVAVFALAWVERSVTVVLAGLMFSAALVVADVFAYSMAYGELRTKWGWTTFILGAVLLFWSGVLALVRRRA